MPCLLWCSASTQAHSDEVKWPQPEATNSEKSSLLQLYFSTTERPAESILCYWQKVSLLNEVIDGQEALSMTFGTEKHVIKAEENQASSTHPVCLKSYPDADGFCTGCYTFAGASHLQEWMFTGVCGVGFPENQLFLAAFILRSTCLVNSHYSSDD